MSRRLHALMLLVASLLGLLGLNLLCVSLLGGVRLDVTQGQLYRLSEGSLAILDEIDEPVRWTFYYSRETAAEYPAVRTYGARVRELLRAYEAAANGRIQLSEVDPAAFSREEDAAMAAGLTPIPAGEGSRIFFGLVAANSVDQRQVLPRFMPEREALLEYDLTRSLADLSRNEDRTLSILSGLPIQPGSLGARPSHIIDELSAAYQLNWVSPGFSSLPEGGALLLIHPPRLADDQLYLIDQFILRGGRLIVAVDPLALAAFRPGGDGLPPPGARQSSTLEPLLTAWGVSFDTRDVVMDRALGLPVQINEDGINQVRNYPLWFSAGRDQLTRNDLATADLERGINFGSPGRLVLTPVDGIGVRPLVRTSSEGAVIASDVAAANPSPSTLLADYESAEAAPILAVRLSGFFSTAFPDRSEAEHLATSQVPGDVVIFADVDWLDDPFFLREDPSFGLSVVADNPALLLNLVDLAIGDPALLGLRSLPSSARPMTRIEDLRSAAQARYAEEQAQIETELQSLQSELDQLVSGRQLTGERLVGADLQSAIDRLRRDMTTAQDRLRAIERGYREDIDQLEAGLRFWTLWVPGILVLLAGFGVGVWRRRQTR